MNRVNVVKMRRIGTGLLSLALIFSPHLSMATNCEAPLTNSQTLTYYRLYDQLRQRRSRRPGFYDARHSDDSLKRFWRGGWLYLKSIAAENEISVGQLLNDYFVMLDLVESATVNPELLERYREQDVKIQAAIQQLETLPPNAKLKRRHWDLIRQTSSGLSTLGMLVVQIEKTWRDHPSFDPIQPFDEKTMRAFLDGVETLNLDNISEFIREAKYEDDTKAGKERTEEAVEPPPLARESAVALANVSEFQPLGPLPEPTTLEQVLIFGSSLKPQFSYHAKTAFGRELNVTLSEEIVDASGSDQGDVIKRLLRSIMTGRNTRSGIKFLYDVGPNIVEVKTVMHGHKRIFGCLEGDSLRLKRFVDISARRGAYIRRIPPAFCSD